MYDNALLKLNLDTLAYRREQISLKFAKDGIKYNTLNDLLFKNENENNLIQEVKNHETYNVNFANTERTRKSTVIYLQNLLNKEASNKNI